MSKRAITYLMFLAFSFSACGGGSPCQEKHCKDFKTQKEAQKAYDSDKACYADLDRDKDGIACESLGD